MADQMSDKITMETTLIEIAKDKKEGIHKTTLLQDQIIDIVIRVETRIAIGHLLGKTMLLIQKIAVMAETLEFILPLKLPEVITTNGITTTSLQTKQVSVYEHY